MKKRILAVIMMAVMLMATVMSVSAAGSVVATPSVGTTQKPTTENQNKGYIIRTDDDQFKIDDTGADSKVHDAAHDYNKDGNLNKLFESTPTDRQEEEEARVASKAAVKDMVPITKIFDLHDVNGGLPDANGKHVVTLHVPGLTEEHTKVVALHFSNQRHLWEVIKDDKVVVDHAKDTVTVTFDDLSPVMILANKGLTTDTDTKLPQTAGTSSAWMLWTAMALIVVGAGVVVSQKKSR